MTIFSCCNTISKVNESRRKIDRVTEREREREGEKEIEGKKDKVWKTKEEIREL